MTDTPAHTPLPWVIDPTYPSEVQTSQLESITLCWHEQAAGQEITVTGVLPCSLSESAANAAFIVRACNSHYQLVEALRGIIDHFDCSHGNAPGHDHLIPGVWDKDVSNGAKGGTQCVWCEQWNEARAALSQAGGASE